MATPFHTQVSMRGFHFEMAHLTVNLAAGITAADIGKAVSQDTAGPNRFKLAADGDVVFGRLEVVEDRVTEGTLVGTVSFQFSNLLPKSAAAITVGQSVVGAGGGLVKGAAYNGSNFVAEVIGDNVVVVKI